MKYRPPENLIYGRHPIMEALQAGKTFDKLIVQTNLGGDYMQQLSAIAKEQEIPIQRVPVQKLNRLSNNNTHQGVAGFVSVLPYYTIEDLLSSAYSKGEDPLFLVCDSITDVRNFGAIARSAACMGVHGIIFPARGSANINAETIKTSAGALHQIHLCKVRFLDQAMTFLQQNGVQVVASSVHATAVSIDKIDFTVPTVIVMGAEGKGVSPKFLDMADKTAQIPMVGDFDSLNVSVATGIVLYEVVRQRAR